MMKSCEAHFLDCGREGGLNFLFILSKEVSKIVSYLILSPI